MIGVEPVAWRRERALQAVARGGPEGHREEPAPGLVGAEEAATADPDTPVEESMSALDTAIRLGKVLYGGISSYSGKETEAALEACGKNGFYKPVIHQPYYNMLGREIEADLLPVTGKHGLGTIAFAIANTR